ncbi:DUF11 domain-containing protein [Candidatus Saccharibacteria bacterium]|nr:DUF11 domain-containing protein [Candidatus Saccharibacteria bacterium]
MKLFSKVLSKLPKRLLGLAVAAIAVVLPVSSIAATSVTLEGSLGVANVTTGETQYKPSANASYDQVVKVQAFYHNREDPNSNKVAENLKVKIDIPTTPGKTQVVKTNIAGDNTNTIAEQVTVNLDRADAYLEYIPGSAVWRHNAGTNEAVNIVDTKISDEVVYGAGGVVVENAKPCFNFAATVTVLARVRVPGIQIDKTVRVKGQPTFVTSNTAKPGETLEYQIAYKNAGNSTHNNVLIRDNLPPKMQYVAGSTKLKNSGGTKAVADGVTTTGIVVGNYTPGGAAYVLFEVKVPAADQLACGMTEFRNVGIAKPEGMNEFYNTAITKVEKECKDVPAYVCETLKIEKTTGRTVKISDFKTSQTNGATFKHVVINWGDNTTPLTTNNAVGQTHTYNADGTFNIVATATFTVDGQEKTAVSEACKAVVTFGTAPATPITPTTLPNTGAGDVIGIFAAVSAAGAVAHRFVLSRKFVA